MQQLTPQEFDRLVATTRLNGTSTLAAKRVLTEGMPVQEAARQFDLKRDAVYKVIQRIKKAAAENLPVCPCCGQAVHPKEN